MPNLDSSAAIIDALIAFGLGTVVRRIGLWAWNRWHSSTEQGTQSAKLEATARLQGMSVDLAETTYKRYQEAISRQDELVQKIEHQEQQFDEVQERYRKFRDDITRDVAELSSWASDAFRLIQDSGLTIRPIPTRRVQ